MMFWILLLVIALAIVFWPVIRTGMALRRAHRRMRDAFGSQFDNDQNQEQQYDPATGRRKVFGDRDGDYVDFEEVVDVAEVTRREAAARQAQQVVEDQVTDVEWEEVPPAQGR